MAINSLLFFDLESTSTDIFQAEIIEGFFLDNLGKEYHMKSQVNNWNDESQKVHKISQAKMQSYPGKLKAHQDCYNFIKDYKDHLWICYANPKTKYGHIYYDKGVLINSLLECDIDFKIDNILSVYELVKEAYNLGLFEPIKGSKGRKSFSQENVYRAMFAEEYDAHNAREDVLAMKRIYDKITHALTYNYPITDRSKLTLI